MTRAATVCVALALGCGSIDEPATEPAGHPARAEPRPLAMDPAPAPAPAEPLPDPAADPAGTEDAPIESSCPFGYRSVVDDDGTAVCEPPADPVAVARARFEEGLRMFELAEYEDALAAFRDVQELHPLAAVAYDIAMTLEHLDRHDEARRELRRILDDPATPADTRERAESLLRRINEP